jgi:hypothetical protein
MPTQAILLVPVQLGRPCLIHAPQACSLQCLPPCPLQDLIHQVQQQLLARLGDAAAPATPAASSRPMSAFFKGTASGKVAPLSPAQGSRAGSVDGRLGSGSGGSGSYTPSLLGTAGSVPAPALRASKGGLREQGSGDQGGGSSLSGADKRGSAPRRARFADDDQAAAEPEPMAGRMASAVLRSEDGVAPAANDSESLMGVRRAKSVTAGLPPIPPKRAQPPMSASGLVSGPSRGRLSTIFSDGRCSWDGCDVSCCVCFLPDRFIPRCSLSANALTPVVACLRNCAGGALEEQPQKGSSQGTGLSALPASLQQQACPENEGAGVQQEEGVTAGVRLVTVEEAARAAGALPPTAPGSRSEGASTSGAMYRGSLDQGTAVTRSADGLAGLSPSRRQRLSLLPPPASRALSNHLSTSLRDSGLASGRLSTLSVLTAAGVTLGLSEADLRGSGHSDLGVSYSFRSLPGVLDDSSEEGSMMLADGTGRAASQVAAYDDEQGVSEDEGQGRSVLGALLALVRRMTQEVERWNRHTTRAVQQMAAMESLLSSWEGQPSFPAPGAEAPRSPASLEGPESLMSTHATLPLPPLKVLNHNHHLLEQQGTSPVWATSPSRPLLPLAAGTPPSRPRPHTATPLGPREPLLAAVTESPERSFTRAEGSGAGRSLPRPPPRVQPRPLSAPRPVLLAPPGEATAAAGRAAKILAAVPKGGRSAPNTPAATAAHPATAWEEAQQQAPRSPRPASPLASALSQSLPGRSSRLRRNSLSPGPGSGEASGSQDLGPGPTSPPSLPRPSINGVSGPPSAGGKPAGVPRVQGSRSGSASGGAAPSAFAGAAAGSAWPAAPDDNSGAPRSRESSVTAAGGAQGRHQVDVPLKHQQQQQGTGQSDSAKFGLKAILAGSGGTPRSRRNSITPAGVAQHHSEQQASAGEEESGRSQGGRESPFHPAKPSDSAQLRAHSSADAPGRPHRTSSTDPPPGMASSLGLRGHDSAPLGIHSLAKSSSRDGKQALPVGRSGPLARGHSIRRDEDGEVEGEQRTSVVWLGGTDALLSEIMALSAGTSQGAPALQSAAAQEQQASQQQALAHQLATQAAGGEEHVHGWGARKKAVAAVAAVDGAQPRKRSTKLKKKPKQGSDGMNGGSEEVTHQGRQQQQQRGAGGGVAHEVPRDEESARVSSTGLGLVDVSSPSRARLHSSTAAQPLNMGWTQGVGSQPHSLPAPRVTTTFSMHADE